MTHVALKIVFNSKKFQSKQRQKMHKLHMQITNQLFSNPSTICCFQCTWFFIFPTQVFVALFDIFSPWFRCTAMCFSFFPSEDLVAFLFRFFLSTLLLPLPLNVLARSHENGPPDLSCVIWTPDSWGHYLPLSVQHPPRPPLPYPPPPSSCSSHSPHFTNQRGELYVAKFTRHVPSSVLKKNHTGTAIGELIRPGNEDHNNSPSDSLFGKPYLKLHHSWRQHYALQRLCILIMPADYINPLVPRVQQIKIR